jgi:stearoyl-CoA desaturase (delta-9 desaturase)
MADTPIALPDRVYSSQEQLMESPYRVRRLERLAIVLTVILPFAALIAAIAMLWGGAVGWVDLSALLIGYLLAGFGISVGYHRLLSHRSFKSPAAVRATFGILGSMAAQGSVIDWVADHRKHHAFTDQDGDPHSPHTHGGEGLRAVLGGLVHAHVAWLLRREDRPPAGRYARELVADPVMRFVDRWFLVWVALGFILPFAYGLALGGSLAAGLTAVLWGGFVRMFFVHHATWSVNSICHMYGSRPFRSRDAARNNWAVALISLGEGWHHNHHVFPRSATTALNGRQLDPSYLLIRTLARLRLASDLQCPSEALMRSRRRLPEA